MSVNEEKKAIEDIKRLKVCICCLQRSERQGSIRWVSPNMRLMHHKVHSARGLKAAAQRDATHGSRNAMPRVRSKARQISQCLSRRSCPSVC